MANLVKAGGSGAGLTAEAFLDAGAQGFSEARPTSEGGGTPFLKCDKESGDWTMGQENTACPADSLWAVFVQTFSQGWVAWKGLTLEAKQMATIGTPPVDETTLPPVAAKTGWEPNVGVVLVCVECPSDEGLIGTMAIFEQRSRGGIEAWNKLYDATMARARSGKADFAPVVSLSHTSYEHKEWGTVFKPLFVPEDWDSPDSLLEEFGTPPEVQSKDGDQGSDVKPVSRRRAAAPEIEDSAGDARAARRARRAAQEEADDADVIEETPAPRRRRRGAE